MKTRLAMCGHDYLVPDHFLAGRRRLKCDECVQLDAIPAAAKARILTERALKGAAGRWDRPAPRADRRARCGHMTPYSPGPQRCLCEMCSQPRSRSCPTCETDITARRANVKYCSLKCSEVARGQRLPSQLPERQCALPTCRATFQPKSRRQRCCSEQHGKNLWNRESRADGRQPMVSGDPDKRRAALRRKTQLRRARMRGVEAETVDRDVVGERDGWKCGICRRKVDRSLPYPHPNSPSLDHVIPLADHGPHTYANCRIAHLRCNNLRSNRGGNEQLALVG